MSRSETGSRLWLTAGWVVIVAGAVGMLFLAAQAQEHALVPATTRPTTLPLAIKPLRLVLPWSKLSSLTDEQKLRIAEIHKKSLGEQKVIRAKEQQEILALLSDAQRKELTELLEKQRMEKKLKRRAAEDE